MAEFKEDNLSLVLRETQMQLVLFGHQKDDPSARCDFRVNSNYELIYVLGGTSLITIEKTHYELHGGEMIIIPAFVSHKIDTLRGDLHHNYWMHFDMNQSLLTQKIIELILENWNGHSYYIGENKVCISVLAWLEKEKQTGGEGCFQMTDALFRIFLVELIRCSGLDRKIADIPLIQNTVYWTVLQYMQKNYKEINTVSEIAHVNHISESYCTKLFREYQDTSPAKYLMQLKMKEATRLLHQTEKSVQEISELLQFSSSYHFSNTFKKYLKVTPTYYRKSNLYI